MTTRHVNNPLLKRIHADTRAKLAAENEHALGLRARHAEITARLDALAATRGAALIEARFTLAKAKAAKKARKRKQKPLTDLPMFAMKGQAA